MEGDPETRVVPEVMVVRGVHTGLRGSYRLWEEGKPPDFVLEVGSTSTHLKEGGTSGGRTRGWSCASTCATTRGVARSRAAGAVGG